METSNGMHHAEGCFKPCDACVDEGLQVVESPLGRPPTLEEALDMLEEDPVYYPAHYTYSDIEVWDAIRSWDLGYFTGAAVKYIARHEHKGSPVQDLEKAIAYLQKEVQHLRG